MGIALVALSVAFFYKAAELDNASRFLWTGCSIGLWLLCFYLLGRGLLAGVLLQVGLFIAITIINMIRD